MKKYIIYSFIIVSGLLFSRCSDDFLDSEPLTTITDVNFYRTIEDAELAIIGCYDGVQQLYAGGVAFPVASEVMSDNCFGGTGNNDALNYQVIDEFDLSRSPGEVNIFNDNWISYYEAIYRCNILLEKMDQTDWEGDTTKRNSIEAEARFLRAYSYFDMVRLWESVPLLTAPSDANIPQSDPNEIYKVIAEDLLFAAEYGSEIVEPGRVNKWAAKAYLGRVYLFYTGYYNQSDLVGLVTQQQVLDGLEEVIENPNYGLVENFADLWPAASSEVDGDELVSTYAGKDNKETIFAIKYNITSDYNGNTDGNHWLVMLGLRAQAFSPYGRGWGAGTVNPEFYEAFDASDLRRDASIIAIQEENLDFDNSDQREYTGYTNKKYTPIANPDGTDVAEANGAVNFMIGQFQDYVVMRYADVLLMAAELGSVNAENYLNQVRSRAGLPNAPATMNNIMRERRLEFAFEGIRYWDLLRQGVETAASALEMQTTVLNGGVETPKSVAAEKFRSTKGFQMIPQDQVTRSAGVLEQNEGWN